MYGVVECEPSGGEEVVGAWGEGKVGGGGVGEVFLRWRWDERGMGMGWGFGGMGWVRSCFDGGVMVFG